MATNPAEMPESGKPIEIGFSADFSREKIDRRVSVAPMMDWTDRHCRFFLRGFSPTVLLYTEMINARALVRGDRATCLYREVTVVITDWTDIPLPWPLCRALGSPGGASGLLAWPTAESHR